MNTRSKFAHLFSLLAILIGGAHSALAETNSASPKEQCLAACHAFIDGSGYELKACVTHCEKKFAPQRLNTVLNICETYEPGCERPGSGDEIDGGGDQNGL